MAGITKIIFCTGITLFLSACALRNVSPPVELISSDEISVPEDELLDVSVSVFTPLDEFTGSEDINIANLRDAEALYVSWQLADTLRDSNHWGGIHVAPGDFSSADVRVSGEILQSDGQSMRLQVRVEDSRGLVWFDRPYLQVLDEPYPLNPQDNQVPFQSIYSQIANDIRNYAVDNFSRETIIALRNVSQLRFAAQFAPERYQSYLQPAGNGLVETSRLPAMNDGIFEHIINIEDRHYSFLDALQNRYETFIARIDSPYRDFIRLSYRTTQYINDAVVEQEEERRKGTPSSQGVTANPQDNYKVFKKPGSRIDKIDSRSNSLNSGGRRRIYSSNLALSGQVFEQDIAPLNIQVNNRSVELTGTVDEQYSQWQEILHQMIELEIGSDLARPDL